MNRTTAAALAALAVSIAAPAQATDPIVAVTRLNTIDARVTPAPLGRVTARQPMHGSERYNVTLSLSNLTPSGLYQVRGFRSSTDCQSFESTTYATASFRADLAGDAHEDLHMGPSLGDTMPDLETMTSFAVMVWPAGASGWSVASCDVPAAS